MINFKSNISPPVKMYRFGWFKKLLNFVVTSIMLRRQFE